MIGAMTPASVIAAQLAQPQQPQAPFQWGAGGRRMTPEDIARERALAARMTQVDYSPVASPWQGLARVSENLVGAMRERKADKAAERNADYGQQIIQSLLNPGGVPSASGAPGDPPPGANIAQLSAIMADPYVPDSARAVAQMQLDMANFERKQQLQAQYAEPTPEERLAKVAFPNDPARQLQFLQGVAANKEDPYVNIIGNDTFGTYAGRQSGLNAILGGGASGATTKEGDIIPDPRKAATGAPPVSAAPAAATMLEPWQYDSFVQSMGKDAAEDFLRRQGISWGAR